MTPRRIQRKRTKGWRMPANTVYVGRPSKWGNPYAVVPPWASMTKQKAVARYKKSLLAERARAPKAFARWIAPLRGKNLACWCREDEPHCHADILLRLANKESE